MKNRLILSAMLLAGVVTVAGAQQGRLPAPSAPQTPAQPTFRTDVNAVLLDVRVVDGQGKFVDGLTKDDFRILEDGGEQVISSFSTVNIPIVLRDRRPDAPRVLFDTAS